MLPNGRLSSRAVVGEWVDPVRPPRQPGRDVARGGVALHDSSQGMRVQLWTLELVGDDVVLSAPSVPRQVLFSARHITEVALAFDQAMHPFVAYIQAGVAKYWWTDPTIAQAVHVTLGADCFHVRCTLDDTRTGRADTSDIVLCYQRGDQLCVRYQRERFQTGHALMKPGERAELVSVGFSTRNRLQFHVRHATAVAVSPLQPPDITIPKTRYGDPLPDLPTTGHAATAQQKPLLSDAIGDLFRRSGVAESAVDARGVDDTDFEGLKVASEGGADALVQSLQAAFFFDPVECDQRIVIKPRGGDPVKALTADDLVEREPSALTITRMQEAELLRKVNLTTLDSTIDYASNQQSEERRSNTIHAKGESTLELPITATPAFAASIAKKRLGVAWGETRKYQFHLSLAHSDLTPGDVVTLTDGYGSSHRMRLTVISEEEGRLEVEAIEDAFWIYRDVSSVGTIGKPPTSTTPGVIGNTQVTVLNLPVLHDSDDASGYYLAARGTGSAWTGAEVQVSVDGGATIAWRTRVSTRAVMGKNLTVLAPEVSDHAPSWQTLKVAVNGELESVSKADAQRYRNRAAIQHGDGTWEIIQFQAALATQPGVYELSGLVRGRYATTPAAVPSGSAFVLLDSAVVFASMPYWMLLQQLHLRAISDGQETDEAHWIALPKGSVMSQTEWPVHGLYRRREPNGTVTVGWIGRARLGIETAPH